MTISYRSNLLLLLAPGLALVAAVVIFVALPVSSARASAAQEPAALAANVISGTVLWKDSEEPAEDVRVVVADPVSLEIVAEATTDSDGVYMLLVGVGNWLVEVPSTQKYFGYGQLITVLPHTNYTADFFITERPPTPTPGPTNTPAPTNTPGPTNTAAPPRTATAQAAAAASKTAVAPKATGTAGPNKLPNTGDAADGDPGLGYALVLAAAVALCFGLAVRGLSLILARESQRKGRR